MPARWTIERRSLRLAMEGGRPVQRPTPTINAIAYHEAAHAVVADSVGREVVGCWASTDRGTVWHVGPPWSSISAGMIAVAGVCGEALAAPASGSDSIERILQSIDRAAEGIVEREVFGDAACCTVESPHSDFHALAQTLIDGRWPARSWPSFLRLVRALAREAIRADWHDFTMIAACLAAEGGQDG